MTNLYKKICLFLLALLCLTPALCLASTHERTKTKILKSQIYQVRSSIKKAEEKSLYLKRRLERTEYSIKLLSEEIPKTRQRIQYQKKSLQQLQAQQRTYTNKKAKQQQALASQLRSAYMAGHIQYIKLLLNQQQPEKISRMLTYFQYFNNSRLRLIKQYKNTLKQLTTTQQQIQQRSQHLQELVIKQRRQRTQLQTNNVRRREILNELSITIEKDHKQLNQLLTKLKNANPFFGIDFAKLKGKLPHPTQGKVINRYDRPIEHSQIRWHGLLIKAPEGQAIHAIAPGKVVFASWMAGYGLLLIIEHGHGYMTVYGRNQTLYKKVGSTVRRGDLIATVGHSGGYTQSGLYFGVRHNGRPLDPESWWS